MSSEDNTHPAQSPNEIPCVPAFISLRARMVLVATREGNPGLIVAERWTSEGHHCFIKACEYLGDETAQPERSDVWPAAVQYQHKLLVSFDGASCKVRA